MSIKQVWNWIFVLFVLAISSSLFACGSALSEKEKQDEYISRFDSMQKERKGEFDVWYKERQPSLKEAIVRFEAKFKTAYDSLSKERRDEAIDLAKKETKIAYDSLSEEMEISATVLFNDLYKARQALELISKERKAEIRKLVDFFSEEYQGIKVLDIIDSLIFDGKHEIPSLVLKLSGVDVEKKVVDPYRQVFTEIGFDVTVGEAIGIYNELLAIEGQEPIEELPPSISISEEGRVYLPGVVVGIFPPIVVGWLGGDYVMMPDLTYVATCDESKDDPFVFVRFTIAPTADEGAWKEEVLFDGTVQELCSNGESSPILYSDKGLMVFKRPNIKVFYVSSDSLIRVASTDNLRSGGLLVFPKSTPSGSLELGFGLLDGTKRVGGSNLVILRFSPIADTLSGSVIRDGTPLYYVTGEKDEPVMLVGCIFSDLSGMFALSAEFCLEGVEEFPYVVSSPGK